MKDVKHVRTIKEGQVMSCHVMFNRPASSQDNHACPVYLLLDLYLTPQQILYDFSAGDVRRPVDGRDIKCGEQRVGVTHG